MGKYVEIWGRYGMNFPKRNPTTSKGAHLSLNNEFNWD